MKWQTVCRPPWYAHWFVLVSGPSPSVPPPPDWGLADSAAARAVQGTCCFRAAVVFACADSRGGGAPGLDFLASFAALRFIPRDG